MRWPVTLFLPALLFLGVNCAGRRVLEPAVSKTTVAHSAEIRGWILKGFWAQAHGEDEEAERCFRWAVLLEGEGAGATEVLQRHLERTKTP